MRKAVAVPYVIALILGVAVIALLGIWFVITGGRFSGQSSDTYCQGQQVEYCTKWVSSSTEPRNPDTWPGQCENTKYKRPVSITVCRDQVLKTGPVAT